jgi:hypothetical protein
VEARFASPDTGFFRYLLGAFYYREDRKPPTCSPSKR